MTSTSDPSRLLSRTRLFARIAFIVGFVMLLMVIVQALPSLRDLLRPVTTANRQITATARLLKVVASLLNANILSAFALFALALVVPAAARLASSGERPSWAVPQDPAFVRNALRFARAAVVFAWVYSIFQIITKLRAQYNFLLVSSNDLSETTPGFLDMTFFCTMTIRTLASSLSYLLGLLLAAYLLRALLMMASNEGAPPQAGPEEKSDE